MISTGITITFATGFLAEILDVGGPNSSRENQNVSHMGTTDWHEFLPTKLTDPGELSVDLQFDPTETPPYHGENERVTITYPDGTTWVFDGHMSSFEPGAPLEEKMTASVTIKASGEIVITAGT
jgi:hypothetical protein